MRKKASNFHIHKRFIVVYALGEDLLVFFCLNRKNRLTASEQPASHGKHKHYFKLAMAEAFSQPPEPQLTVLYIGMHGYI